MDGYEDAYPEHLMKKQNVSLCVLLPPLQGILAKQIL
jgi:hypothetical protein